MEGLAGSTNLRARSCIPKPRRVQLFPWGGCATAQSGAFVCPVRVARLVAPLCLFAPVAAAQPLTRNDYALDFHRGPVQGPGRSVGLAGAYAALAEGIDGVGFNPAAYARRSPHDLAWAQPSAVLDVSFPRNNWDNSGTGGRDFADFAIVTSGLGVNLGPLGVGYQVQVQGYSITPETRDDRRVSVNLAIHRVGAGYLFDGGTLTLGAGLRVGALTIGWDAPIFGTFLPGEVAYTGVAPEFGFTWAPVNERYRVGGAFRTEVMATTEVPALATEDVRRSPAGCQPGAPGCFVVPRSVHLPWEFDLGFVYRFSDVPWNAPWVDALAERHALEARIAADRARRRAARRDDPAWEEAERAARAREARELETFGWRHRAARLAAIRDRRRRYLLIAAGLSVSGPTPRGQGIEAFIDQVAQPSGRGTVLTPRVALEGEAVENRLRLRVGSYVEPSRFEGIGARVHGTLGFDVRLFRWDALKLFDPVDIMLSGTFDVSHNYVDWGVSLGFWR